MSDKGTVTFRTETPKIISYDEIRRYQQEVAVLDTATGESKAYDHCIQVIFDKPFASYICPAESPELEEGLALEMYETRATEYEAAKAVYEAAAIAELTAVYGLRMPRPQPMVYDWRDEAELWLRFNRIPA